MVHHQEVKRLEKGLADLDTWTVAGKWLGISLPRRKAAIDTIWQQAFPVGRNREEFFLNLAEVADNSGVEQFNLEEMTMEQVTTTTMEPTMEEDMPSDPGGAVYGVPVEVPRIDLDSYRVKASFQGNYQQAARFMGGLQGISRAVSVHDLVIRPEGGGIRVDLELDVYVSKQS
jgi:hypothetical protein